jgi:hypothetical protein
MQCPSLRSFRSIHCTRSSQDLWLSRLLELLPIDPHTTISSRRLAQPTAALRAQLDIHPSRADVDCASVGRLQVSGGAADGVIWEREVRFHTLDLVFFRFLLGEDLLRGVCVSWALRLGGLVDGREGCGNSADVCRTFIAAVSESFGICPPWYFDSFDSILAVISDVLAIGAGQLTLRTSSAVMWKVCSDILSMEIGVAMTCVGDTG